MTPRCTGEPISWLRLELHHAGSLQGDERRRVVEHLTACPACSACLEKIRDEERTALPALQLTGPALRRRPMSSWAGRAMAMAGGLAAVAAAVFVLSARPGSGGKLGSSTTVRAKGAALSFSLVREDGERVDGDAGGYRDGERFKALVTCAPGAVTYFDVVVYDEDGASFPLQPAGDFSCGNEVPLPGAFRLTGHDDEEVCLVWSESGTVDRAVIGLHSGPLDRRLCKRLTAEGAR